MVDPSSALLEAKAFGNSYQEAVSAAVAASVAWNAYDNLFYWSWGNKKTSAIKIVNIARASFSEHEPIRGQMRASRMVTEKSTMYPSRGLIK